MADAMHNMEHDCSACHQYDGKNFAKVCPQVGFLFPTRREHGGFGPGKRCVWYCHQYCIDTRYLVENIHALITFFSMAFLTFRDVIIDDRMGSAACVRLLRGDGTCISTMAFGTCHGRFFDAVPIPGIMQEIQVLMTFYTVVIAFMVWMRLDLSLRWLGERDHADGGQSQPGQHV